MRRRLLLEESNDVPALEPTPDGHIALGVNSMNLKNRLCDVETDRRHSLHGPVLRIRSPTATMAPTCRWRSRPQHHLRKSAAHFSGQEIWRSLHVDHERRPGKVLGAVSLAGERMVVFTESRSFDQLPYASVQRIGLSIEALFMQASIQQPIEYRPCRPAPQRQGLIGIIGRI